MINHSINNLLISQIEEVCDHYDHFLHTPHILSETECSRVSFCVSSKRTPMVFICRKPFDNRKNVVLYSGNGGRCNLRSKVASLALSKSKQSLIFFESNFQRPPLDINFRCIKEIQVQICSYKPVPFFVFTAPCKEQLHLCIHETNFSNNIVTTQLSTVLSLFPFGEELNQSRRSVLHVCVFKVIFDLSFSHQFLSSPNNHK